MTTGVDPAHWDAGLDASRARTLKTVGGGEVIITHATGARMVAAWTLVPAPRDPVVHLETAHARARHTLFGSPHTIPAAKDLGDDPRAVRPADRRGARPLTAPAGVGRYTYTPRKILRRVLDHALDHLNQIDQWLMWRRDGVVPTPTDGWVPSTVTLPDDHLPLSPADLDAWLWRIDQAARFFVQRAAGLTPTSSTGCRPTAAGPFASSFTTWRAPRSSIRRRWTRPCRRRIRGRDTRKPAAARRGPPRDEPPARWTLRSSIPASMVSSAPRTR